MTNKYHAQSTKIDGYRFDSAKEANRYRELLLLQRAEKISLLEVHPKFTVLDGFTCYGTEVIRPINYTADFIYWDCDAGRMVVEEVKAFNKKTGKFIITEASNLRIKLFKFRYWNSYEFRMT